MKHNIKNRIFQIAISLIFSLIFSPSLFAKTNDSQTKSISKNKTTEQVKTDSLYVKAINVKNAFGALTSKSSPAAISVIDANIIEKNSVNKIEQALNGTLSGLYSLRNSGQKFGGNEFDFFIRGRVTTGDNKALILVDGIDSNINLIDPKEIESIIVLKDASELSMYGLRGANGVILINTKRGSSTNNYLNLDIQYGIQTPVTIAKKLNSYEYTTIHNEANKNDGTETVYTPADYVNNADVYRFPSTNLPADFLRNNNSYDQYSFSAGGGNDIAKYFALISYMKQDGLFNQPTSQYKLNQTYNERYNFRTNLDLNLGKGFKLNTNISAIFDDRRSPWINSSTNVNNSNNYIYNLLFSTPANAFPLLNPDGSLGGSSEYRVNPIGELSSGTRVENTRQLTANLNLNKDLGFIIKGLSANLQYSFENYNAYYKGNYTLYAVYKQKADDSYTEYGANDTKVNTAGGQIGDYYSNSTFNASANYNNNFGDHKILSTVIFNQHTSNVSGDEPNYKWLGTSAKILYSYKEKYIAQLSGSYQGSNSFVKGKRYGFFPAASLAWIISDEGFMLHSSTIDFLKTRASIGMTGNDKTGAERFLYRQVFYNTGGYGFGNPNGNSPGSYEGTLGNPIATWEKSALMNIGFDLKMFKNKLSVNADYFYENRHSILVNQSNITPNLIGINLPLYNGGTINNKGVESNIKYNTNFGPVKIFLGVNMMYAKNKIVDLKEIAYPENEAYRYRKGSSVNAIFGFESNGIYNDETEIQEANLISSFGNLRPGDIKYIDQNNDGIINNADKKVIGNLFPEFIYGINGGFEIKGFDFSFQTEGSEMFDAVIVPGQFSYYAYNNRWVDTQSGSNAKYPRLSFSSDHNLQTSSYWLEKGHLFRLSSLEFGYSFPKQLSKKILANNVRIYAKMNNIFSTSNVREGRNYETPTAGYTVYPEMKSFLAGLSIKF